MQDCARSFLYAGFMFEFSPQLKEKLIIYFEKKFSLKISAEQADEYLNSMADLYSAFSLKNLKDKKGRDFSARQ